ncbi:dihydrolipoyl dehydrogenase family protein [Streptomyces tendae]|uniref:NAD(P)/FAD-dependent oxidoreductase n=1 Tax=Streptomyces tendae TaxID=1932 RepID=A0ABX6A193_STRTE|nr:NAD(P)/FAD-dependent oxidoreductase [Streptomyces tendae]QER90428.1 NAD(P)/FAD-dependent oxidoreductase [Streptomyces tendae]
MTATVNPDRTQWDVIVLGGAAAGENAAQYASQFSGLSSVLVESDLLGGECSYWACMPSKALLRPVEVVDAACHLPGLSAGLDVDDVLARRDRVVRHLNDTSQVNWAVSAGIDVVRGYGRLAGERTIRVSLPNGSTRTLTARHAVVIDTGSCPAVPDIPGLRSALPWTSRDVTTMREVPRRVAILGGGVVACEAATWLRGLGAAEVTLVHRGEQLLGRYEPFVGALVSEELQERGVQLRPRRTMAEVRRPDAHGTGRGCIHGGEADVTLDDGTVILADEVVVAAGRTPNTDDIGLDTIGLAAGGYLAVDDHQCVRGAADNWLYAIGDVCGRALLTHMGKYQARTAGEVIAVRARNLGDLPSAATGHAGTPQVVFTTPEVGSAGATEQQARDSGIDVEVVEYDLSALAGTYLLRPDYRGRAKLVIDRATDTVVGATFVGAGIAELVHSATTAIVGRIPLSTLWHVVPSYPTVSEVWLRLLETLRLQRHAEHSR